MIKFDCGPEGATWAEPTNESTVMCGKHPGTSIWVSEVVITRKRPVIELYKGPDPLFAMVAAEDAFKLINDELRRDWREWRASIIKQPKEVADVAVQTETDGE